MMLSEVGGLSSLYAELVLGIILRCIASSSGVKLKRRLPKEATNLVQIVRGHHVCRFQRKP